MKNTKVIRDSNNYQDGSIELVVLGMLAALIVVLAVPLFVDSPENLSDSQIEQAASSSKVVQAN